MATYTDRLKAVIPGGAHTYSRGSDQFPTNAPELLQSGQGCHTTDIEGKTYIDYGMALRAVTLGYAHPQVNQAAISAIEQGNNLTRPSSLELAAAETLVALIPSVDMVKFTKNGSTAVSGAVKLARAFTGRSVILRCSDHPFFSFDDWFIGSTVVPKGVPQEIRGLTLSFFYNDLASLKAQIDAHPQKIACVVLEAATAQEPNIDPITGKNFLQQVQDICQREGIVFILDEMITGFRWHLQGAQNYYQITPDLSTFGKGMANGFALAAVCGRADIMQLAGIDIPGQERVFFLSTTHGGEMCALAAFLATISVYQAQNVIDHLWHFGKQFKKVFAQIAAEYELTSYLELIGPDCSPTLITRNAQLEPCLAHRTLFMQEMLNQGILMPCVAFSLAHNQDILTQTEQALRHSLKVYANAIESNQCERFLQGPIIKPVFRKYN